MKPLQCQNWNWPTVAEHLTQNPRILIAEGVVTDCSPLTKSIYLNPALIGIGAIHQSDKSSAWGWGGQGGGLLTRSDGSASGCYRIRKKSCKVIFFVVGLFKFHLAGNKKSPKQSNVYTLHLL